MPEVKAFYGQRLAGQDRTGLDFAADLPYGEHPRQRMDVYFPQSAGSGRPVLLYLHGGGFIRGDKADRANVGWWGARQGFVTLLANYRLAPEAPSGALAEVAAALPARATWAVAPSAHRPAATISAATRFETDPVFMFTPSGTGHRPETFDTRASPVSGWPRRQRSPRRPAASIEKLIDGYILIKKIALAII